jgi:predicted transcriptional regulator
MTPADRSLPTGAELEILRVLWRSGPATVREVHDAFGPRRRTGYTTVLKLLQIMHQKGLVSRDEAERSHIYRARIGENATQRRLLRDLADRAFGGSAASLVMQALSSEKASAQDLAEIRRLLDRKDADGT